MYEVGHPYANCTSGSVQQLSVGCTEETSYNYKCEIANSIDPDQTAPKEQSDVGLHSLLRHFCSNILDKQSELQKRGGIDDNSKILFLIS